MRVLVSWPAAVPAGSATVTARIAAYLKSLDIVILLPTTSYYGCPGERLSDGKTVSNQDMALDLANLLV
jgi:hypothetical protein